MKDTKAVITWTEFEAAVLAVGLVPHKLTEEHWQIRSEPRPANPPKSGIRVVNYWPASIRRTANVTEGGGCSRNVTTIDRLLKIAFAALWPIMFTCPRCKTKRHNRRGPDRYGPGGVAIYSCNTCKESFQLEGFRRPASRGRSFRRRG